MSTERSQGLLDRLQACRPQCGPEPDEDFHRPDSFATRYVYDLFSWFLLLFDEREGGENDWKGGSLEAVVCTTMDSTREHDDYRTPSDRTKGVNCAMDSPSTDVPIDTRSPRAPTPAYVPLQPSAQSFSPLWLSRLFRNIKPIQLSELPGLTTLLSNSGLRPRTLPQGAQGLQAHPRQGLRRRRPGRHLQRAQGPQVPRGERPRLQPQGVREHGRRGRGPGERPGWQARRRC